MAFAAWVLGAVAVSQGSTILHGNPYPFFEDILFLATRTKVSFFLSQLALKFLVSNFILLLPLFLSCSRRSMLLRNMLRISVTQAQQAEVDADDGFAGPSGLD